ncbi:MAG: FtsW/RodA/SpoVE family cell cycle protein [Gemmatimonadales bacterium]|jgi:cell division protein FtsW|nr:FtsW/RodA/SpoVE family cell cycle protein [Gemmatimonadales bacterium]
MAAPAVRHPGELRWETRLLAVLVLTLLVFGVATVYGAASYQTRGGGLTIALSQLSGAILGGLLLVAVARIDYRVWQRLAWPLLLATIALLVLPVLPFTHAIAPIRNGARRWVELGPLRMQPSELARLAVVVWCAMLAAKKGEAVRGFKKGVLPFLVVLGVVSGLILLEPNMSMATLVALCGAMVLFAAGAKLGHFLLLGLAAGLLAVQAILMAPYRLKRVLAFIDPSQVGAEARYQIEQSIIGVGSGRVVGVGFGEGQQKFHLPYAYSDFLFSTIAEEWGFVGVCLVILLFGLFCWVGFRIARTAADPFGQYLAAGLTSAVGLTAFLHMAVSLGLMPTTGLTLPFMSFGRSSLVISLVGVGMLISVGRMRGRPVPRGRAGDA